MNQRLSRPGDNPDVATCNIWDRGVNSAYLRFEARSEGDHDDIVLAVCIGGFCGESFNRQFTFA